LLSNKFRSLSIGLIFILLMVISPANSGFAQDSEPDGPVYVVQEGDSLWSIAVRFGLSLEELTSANGITDPSQLTIGSQLVIPGLEGISGELTTIIVYYGDSLRGISRSNKIPVNSLAQLNRLTSPSEIYPGYNLVIPVDKNNSSPTMRSTLKTSQSLLELSISQGKNPWNYVLENDLQGTWEAVPNDVFHIQTNSVEEDQTPTNKPSALPEAISEIEIDPSPFIQGKTANIKVTGDLGLTLEGALNGEKLNFFPVTSGEFVSLQGIHAMTDPGVYTMVISGTIPTTSTGEDQSFSYAQTVLTSSGGYSFDPVLIVPPETIDPAVTVPEDAQWFALASPTTPEKMWDGQFLSPAPAPFDECWPSFFGSRRSYNGSPFDYFHSGLDFCGGVGTEILAPANGKVVFAGPLTVRGNATMIDHGWGVYTGYMHQSEILVEVGDLVEAGQLIGFVGGTGRVTGPHLHWEIFVNGIQVDPMDWLQEEFPQNN
jgi:murein DD-endopeptidase MepM/ murein hydrolase activator NlpD